MIELADVEAAAERLAGVAHRTPVVTSRTLDERVGARVHIKAECFQRGGAFKFRGAYNKISSLDADALARGVVAYSSGNHAQAVALAAKLLGSRATIVMPEDAPAAKLEATRGYGAEVVLYDRWTESREEIGAALAAERGARARAAVRRPARDGRPGNGGARAARATSPTSTSCSSPVSGGGLIAGCSTVAKALRPAMPRRRRRAGDRQRHAAVARGRRARPDRRAAHDRRRPAGDRAGRADVRGQPAAGRRDRDRERRGDRRRDGLPLRPAEARRRAERSDRRRRALLAARSTPATARSA